MQRFPLKIAPNASNRPRTLFRPPDGPTLEHYGFFMVLLDGQVSKSYGFDMVFCGWFYYGFRFSGVVEIAFK